MKNRRFGVINFCLVSALVVAFVGIQEAFKNYLLLSKVIEPRAEAITGINTEKTMDVLRSTLHSHENGSVILKVVESEFESASTIRYAFLENTRRQKYGFFYQMCFWVIVIVSLSIALISIQRDKHAP